MDGDACEVLLAEHARQMQALLAQWRALLYGGGAPPQPT